ncbi:5'-methylthioadenosine/S-adenosylhomocysteine nucleosidase, partial [Bacteroides sp. CAG:633]
AGGIDTRLRVGDVVASDRLVYHDVYCGNDGTSYGQVQGMPLYYEASAPLLQHALNLNDGAGLESRIHGGLICTGDRFVEAAAELADIKSHFPEGLAVDMESAAIAQTCFVYGVPFLSFRIISDTPGAHDDNFSQYRDFWATMAERSFRTTWAFLEGLGEVKQL